MSRRFKFIHDGGLSFTSDAAPFFAQELKRSKTGIPVKPTCQDNLGRYITRFASKVRKNGLSDVLCQMHISIDHAHRGGIHHLQMSFHEAPEGGFRTVPTELSQQLAILTHSV